MALLKRSVRKPFTLDKRSKIELELHLTLETEMGIYRYFRKLKIHLISKRPKIIRNFRFLYVGI